ncbi:MAG: hybrid sensor histidine kinase/response regulator [Salinivirgaceae bacterium]|nr:MAG: hybrid sensor histidine kinase/response regulator [Salinivirgaceae bacterium]
MEKHNSGKNARILIVDDIVSNIQVLANMLSPHGYEIEFSTNGIEALDWLNQEPFDLVLLDIMMPEMDGYEVCTKLKENPNTSDIPVIFITAKTDQESIQKGFKVGAVDYILKPYHESELLERVKTHITLQTQKKELITSNQAKDRLFSIIAHDLKNPMSNIFGFIKLMHDNYDQLEDEKKKKYIGYLYESSSQNLELLEELLEWSRTQTKSKPIKPISFRLSKVVKEAINSTINDAIQKNIIIKEELEYEDTIIADFNMIKTVIRNLIGNAIKFTESGGSITISSSIDDEVVQLNVTDTGVGISKNKIDQLFNIENKISTPGTNNEKGTGLGLILCKEFIEQHNGKIWVESELNKGSKFSFNLKVNGPNG